MTSSVSRAHLSQVNCSARCRPKTKMCLQTARFVKKSLVSRVHRAGIHGHCLFNHGIEAESLFDHLRAFHAKVRASCTVPHEIDDGSCKRVRVPRWHDDPSLTIGDHFSYAIDVGRNDGNTCSHCFKQDVWQSLPQ